MKLLRTIFLLAFPFYLFSCGTQQKIPNYLENLRDTTGKSSVKYPEMRIQKNDLLSIQVYSASTKKEASDAPYNLPPVVGSSTGNSTSGGGGGTGGFLVDSYGDIEYPRIGILHAEGLTKQELATLIKQKINQPDSVLQDPAVIIRFQNLKITVLGEVKNPGVISFPGERVNVMEAMGLAGDITEFGLKNTVKVIRETSGDREVATLDLSSKDVFQSPYYNLMQNDIVLVEPSKRKVKKTETDAAFQRVSFAVSIITAIALIYNVFK